MRRSELAAIEERASGEDVPRLVAEVRRLQNLVDACDGDGDGK